MIQLPNKRPSRRMTAAAAIALGCLLITACSKPKPIDNQPITGVLNWRTVNQDGTSVQTGLPTKVALEGKDKNLRWSKPVPGKGTAVIAEYADGPRLFVVGYTGDGAELLETIYCLDPETGKQIWSKGYADFLSDIVYNRYSVGAPAVDPDTGNVYFQTSQGLLNALDRDGKELWQVSLMETYGKLTFPNGRTGTVTLFGNLAIVNCISTNWGSEGPARNRFYAFNKYTGQLVWSSTPGVGPPFLKDSSFSTPIIESRRGKFVFYAGTGCGNLVCVNVNTGQPIWRYQMSFGGVNASPVIYDNGTPNFPADDLVIQVHGKENVGDTGRGYMIAIRADHAYVDALEEKEKPLHLNKDYVAWRNDDVSMFTSSPTIVNGVVYQCTIDGHLVAIDAKTGKTLWKKKMSTDQLHASPVYADGRMYVPFWHEGLYILEPTREGPKNIELLKLPEDELSIGSPTLWNGKVYMHTTKRLMCFGNAKGGGKPMYNSWVTRGTGAPRNGRVVPGPMVGLSVTPAEFVLRPTESLTPTVRKVNAWGSKTSAVADGAFKLEKWIPPTAKVKVRLDALIDKGTIVAAGTNKPSAGAFKASVGKLTGTMRGRVLPKPPYAADFESFDLSLKDDNDATPYAHPPLPWIGARMKWQVREDPTDPKNKVLAKTLDRVLFMRSTVFIGHATDKGYTLQADVMTDGNRRGGSVVGVVNQRYIIAIDANKNVIEVSSNPNNIAITAPFKVKTKTWYTLKTKVQVLADGSGVIYGKAWPRGSAEPEKWSIAAKVPNVQTNGSPALYGFSPQSRHRVYIDNVKVTPND